MPPSPASRHAAITSVGHYLPEERLTNSDLEEMVQTNDEWIRTRTGIRERRILGDDGKATSYMATEAAREALDKRDLDPDAVDVIVVATVTPDMFFPATACLVQDNLGASNAWGFDLSAACSGFLYGLTTGAQFIESGRAETVLVIGADKMVMERNDLTPDDVDYLVPHQANKRIIDATAERMGLPSEKVMVNIDRYGNTTAATIPLCLADWEETLDRGDQLVLTAFGGGFTWGASYLTWAYDGQ